MKLLTILIIVYNVRAVHREVPLVVSDFVNCLYNLIQTNFNEPGLIVFPHSITASAIVVRMRDELLKKIHNGGRHTILVTSADNKSICHRIPKLRFTVLRMDPFKATSIAKYFIIVVDGFDDFTRSARKLIRSRFWNPRAKFLILLYRLAHSENEIVGEVEDLLSCLFGYNVINVAVVVPQMRSTRGAVIYSWKPYDPPHHCGYHNETAHNRLLVQNSCNAGVVEHTRDIFHDRVPVDMHGCTINIIALEKQPLVSRRRNDPNIEKKIITSVLKRFNYSVNFEIINAHRGERDEHGKWDGGLGELAAKRGQILLGGIFPDFDVQEDFDGSTKYLADSYAWVVARALPNPPWYSLTETFRAEVWWAGATVFVMSTVTWRALAQLEGASGYESTLAHCLLNSWIVSLGFPAYARPATQSLRIFFATFNVYCILFLTAYQAKLIDVLRNPSFGKRIDTIQELVESGMEFGGIEELRDIFYNTTDPIDSTIGERWVNVDNMTRALLDVIVHRNFSLLCSRLELSYYSGILPELTDSFGRNNYYAFEKDTFVVPLEFIAVRGFPFMTKLSLMLNLYKQFGVNAIVKRYFTTFNKRQQAKIMRLSKIKGSNVGSLTINHLQSAFFVLGLGAICGTIILLIELLTKNIYVTLIFTYVKNQTSNMNVKVT